MFEDLYWIFDWLRRGGLRWIVLAWAGLVVVIALVRFVRALPTAGFGPALRHAVTLSPEAWRAIAVLVMVIVFVTCAFTMPAGVSF